MSSSPPPVVKKPRPKPKPRLALPSDNPSSSTLGVAGGRGGAGPSRSPSIPASQPGRLSSFSSKTPASRTPSAATPISIQSSPEPQQQPKNEEKPAIRRSSRPTNSLLKRRPEEEEEQVVEEDHPTWVTHDGDDDGEEEIDELEASSLESVGKGKGRMREDEETRLQKEEEDRLIKLRQDEDERRFNEQFQRKPRGWLDKNHKEMPKGNKGKVGKKAPSMSRSPGRANSAQVISDSDDEMASFDKQKSDSEGDDNTEDGGRGRNSTTIKKRGRAPGGTQKKRKLVHDWSVKDTMSNSSESDSDVKLVGDGPSGKTKKATTRGEAKAVVREKSASLTPPPELDPMILMRVNNQVRFALAEDHRNPLLERHGQASESDDDDFAFSARASRQPSPPPARHVNARAGPSKSNSTAPIVLDDSDDEIEASPAPTQAPVRQRNPKTFDAPLAVTIRVKVVSHHDRTMVSERAVAQFEKKKKYELDRFDTLASLFETVAEDCNYRLADLIMTNDSKRIYRSTTADTLGIYNDALFIGYRKDIYEAELKKKKDEEEARLARLAVDAEEGSEDDNDPSGGGSDDSDDNDPRPNPSSNNAPPPPRPPPPTQEANNARRSASAAVGDDAEPKLRLTLRGPHGEAKFMVKSGTKISSLIKNYGSKKGLAKEVWEKLKVEDPDGETMNSEKMIGDYEVEDGDMLSVT